MLGKLFVCQWSILVWSCVFNSKSRIFFILFSFLLVTIILLSFLRNSFNFWLSICDINYVIRFLGTNNSLAFLREQEVEIIRAFMGDNKVRCSFQYKIGDMIEILGGHCKGYLEEL